MRQRYYYTRAFPKVKPQKRFYQKAESRGSPPCASAHFGNDAVHGMVHGDTQLVDTLSHLRFHGIPAVGHHHSTAAPAISPAPIPTQNPVHILIFSHSFAA